MIVDVLEACPLVYAGTGPADIVTDKKLA